jgi:hypothetical protein
LTSLSLATEEAERRVQELERDLEEAEEKLQVLASSCLVIGSSFSLFDLNRWPMTPTVNGKMS